jgi:CHAD domain-containing protein
MPATVELVLAVDAVAAGEWMAGPGAAAVRVDAKAHAGGTSPRAKSKAGGDAADAAAATADIGATLADAISRMPGVATLGSAEPSKRQAVIPPEAAKGSQPILLAIEADGGRRVTAQNITELSPGVWRCETICDVALPDNVSAPADIGEAVPPFVRDALDQLDQRRAPSVHVFRRRAWRWTAADGAVVDIELRDACLARADAMPSGARTPAGREHDRSAAVDESPDQRAAVTGFCELRLASPVVEPQQRAQATHGASPAPSPTRRPTRAAALQSGPDTVPQGLEASAAFHRTIAAALQALFAAAGVLVDTLPVFPALADGFTCACAGAPAEGETPVRAGRIDLSHARNPHDALIAIGSAVARHWFGNEAGARIGADPEYVHQMRVALRRLKTLLKTFPRWADAAWERTIAPELDWLGALLGQARDLDVFVDTTLPSLAAADAEPDTWSTLHGRAVARRDEARARVCEALRTRRYAALSLAWLKWLAVQRCSAGPHAMIDKPLADYAAKRVRKHYVRLMKQPGLTGLTPIERHHQRIEAKRLRYTLEFFEPLASRKTRRKVSKQLSRIQSVLGDGNDMTSALRFLEALDVPPYQHGYARGWCEAVLRWSAAEGERLLRGLRKPKIVRTH